MAVVLILALVVTLIIGPIIVNVGLDKKQDWAEGFEVILALVFMIIVFVFAAPLITSSDLGFVYSVLIFFGAPALYELYVNYIFRYLIYVVLRFFIIKPIILLDSSMTAKIEQNKNVIKNNQNNQNNQNNP